MPALAFFLATVRSSARPALRPHAPASNTRSVVDIILPHVDIMLSHVNMILPHVNILPDLVLYCS